MEFDHKKIWWFDSLYKMLYEDSNITKFNLGRKLFNKRAINYLSLEDNDIEAVVYDGKKHYHEVKISVNLLDYSTIEMIKGFFSENTHLSTELINGDFNKDLDALLKDSGINIFFGWSDMSYRCSCRKTKKCEHIASVLHRILNEIIFEPMLLFNLRGLKPDDIFSIIMNDPDFELYDTKIPDEMKIEHYEVKKNGIHSSEIDPEKYFGVDFPDIDTSFIKTSKLTDSRIYQGKIRDEFYDIYKSLTELLKYNIKKY